MVKLKNERMCQETSKDRLNSQIKALMCYAQGLVDYHRVKKEEAVDSFRGEDNKTEHVDREFVHLSQDLHMHVRWNQKKRGRVWLIS